MNSKETIKARAKKSKRTMFIYLRFIPILIILIAAWSLLTGKAQSVNKEVAAWVAIFSSFITILVDIYTYITLPDRDAFNIPPGNIRIRFMLRSVEVIATYYIAISALGVLLDGLLRLNKMVSSPYNWFGILLVVVGLVIGRWTMSTYFNKGQGTTVSYEPTQHLVSEGPFRYVRNPMIIGSEIVVAGLAVILSSYMLLAILFLIIVGDHIYVINIEEKELEARFGQSYLDYKARVPRWIPRRPKIQKN